MYFKCMCMLFSFHTNFFEVFFFISKFLMKIVKLFPNLNFVVDFETYLLFYSLFKTFVYSLKYASIVFPSYPPMKTSIQLSQGSLNTFSLLHSLLMSLFLPNNTESSSYCQYVHRGKAIHWVMDNLSVLTPLNKSDSPTIVIPHNLLHRRCGFGCPSHNHVGVDLV